MQAFNYKLSLATTKAKLGMDIYRLNQLVSETKDTALSVRTWGRLGR